MQQQAIKEKKGIMALGTPGQLLTGYEQEGDNNQVHGETIFNDTASGAICVKN